MTATDLLALAQEQVHVLEEALNIAAEDMRAGGLEPDPEGWVEAAIERVRSGARGTNIRAVAARNIGQGQMVFEGDLTCDEGTPPGG